jgi:hypothetical protein
MGNQVTEPTKPTAKFIIERIIGSGFSIGISKYGEQLKLFDSYHNLISVHKINDKLEYLFDPNIILSIERTNKKLDYDNSKNKLYYKLTQGHYVEMGETIYPYKTIGTKNSQNLDLIDELQNSN